jgi:hypothetical protein
VVIKLEDDIRLPPLHRPNKYLSIKLKCVCAFLILACIWVERIPNEVENRPKFYGYTMELYLVKCIYKKIDQPIYTKDLKQKTKRGG